MFAAAISLARIAGELDSTYGVEFRELTRDLLWMLSGAWFLANVLRVLDTMKPSIFRIFALVSLGIVAIWFSSTQMIGLIERGIRFSPQVQILALLLYGIAIGIIALLSVFRHGLIKNPRGIVGDPRRWLSVSLDTRSVFGWLIRILVHPFKSIRRDPIRWSAIAGALIWPTISVFAFPAFLAQGIAITCAIRYADTYEGHRIIRIGALALATGFVWFNFAVTVPFGQLQIAWLGPSLVLWTGSAVSAMFRPSTTTYEAVNADDALPFHSYETSGLGSEEVREVNNNQME